MRRIIRQTVLFPAGCEKVYTLLMTSRAHARFTGSKARISRRIGGRISAYDGYISGRNLELVPGRKIVQAWRGSDWPKGAESTVTFLLTKTKNGCRLRFTQRGVPPEHFASISKGWIEFYWKPMKQMLKR